MARLLPQRQPELLCRCLDRIDGARGREATGCDAVFHPADRHPGRQSEIGAQIAVDLLGDRQAGQQEELLAVHALELTGASLSFVVEQSNVPDERENECESQDRGCDPPPEHDRVRRDPAIAGSDKAATT